MKKLLNILASFTLSAATVATVVACGTEMGQTNAYKDSELNNIKDKNIVSQIRATSQLAKIMIGGRHENGNYNSVPMFGFFNSSSPTFNLNNGQVVDFTKEKNDLEKYQPELQDKNPIDGQKRRAESSYHFVENKHNQGIVREGQSYNFNTNIWSTYDTGALTNYTIMNNEAMNDKFIETEYGFWDDEKGAGFLTEELINSNMFDKEKSVFSYENIDGEKIEYGKQVFDGSYGSYRKSSMGVIDLMLSALQVFGNGSEFVSLSGLNKILPVLKTRFETGDKQNFALILAATGIVYGGLLPKWFEDTEASELKEAGIDFTLPGVSELVKKLTDIMNGAGGAQDLMGTAMELIAEPTEAALYGNTNVDFLMTASMEISSIIKKILTINKETFNENKFNSLLGNNISDGINNIFNLIASPFLDVDIYPQAKAFLLYFADAFQTENFPTWQITSILGNMFKPFLNKVEGDDHKYEKNKEFEAKVKELYEYSGDDYNQKIELIDPTSEYGKKIRDTLGAIDNEDGSVDYAQNSLFGSLDNMANDPNNSFYNGLQQTVYSNDGYFQNSFDEINERTQKSWFDLVFMDKNWDIKADGIGVNNTKLGLFEGAEIPIEDGPSVKTNSITYQLDYYGPKDESTDLSMHKNEINAVGEANMPQAIKDMTPEEQMKYDGLGNKYMENSKNVKYSYIVTISNITGDNANPNWKFVDFEWYYNDQRYY
ncbi:lipoprotein [Spiroplasma endosymbiont of Anurida maritima]|uniref:lipoprotein n=1 Tax=Spiroplasma endosymbiont of Anurida maritima TaxID=2967972 RepID=UPI0036D374B6